MIITLRAQLKVEKKIKNMNTEVKKKKGLNTF